MLTAFLGLRKAIFNVILIMKKKGRKDEMVNLKGDERLDYLLAEEIRIIQSPSVFAFSLDAVLLAKFVYVPIQKGNLLTFAVEME